MEKLTTKNAAFLGHTVAAVVFLAAYISIIHFGESSLFNDETAITSSLLMIITYFSALLATRFDLIGLNYCIFTMYIYIFPRIGQYLIADSSVQTPFHEYTLKEVNSGSHRLLFFLFVFYFSIGFSELLYKRINYIKKEDKYNSEISFLIYLFMFIIFIIISLFEYKTFSQPNNSIFYLKIGDATAMSVLTKIIITISSSDIILFLMLSLFIYDLTNENMRAVGIKLLLLFLAAFIFFMQLSALGSRSGGFRISLFSAALFFLTIGTAKLSLSSRLAVLAATLFLISAPVLVNFLSLPLAQNTRAQLNNSSAQTDNSSAQTENSSALPATVTERATMECKDDCGSLWVLNRLGLVDYFIITQSREPDKACSKKYLNFEYYAKNVANFLVPGNPYPEAALSSSNAFGLCYRTGNTQTQYYNSEHWTLPGLSRLLFGTVPAIFVVFAVGAVFGGLTGGIVGSKGPVGFFFASVWLYVLPTYTLYTMGVDHSVNAYIIIAIRTALVALIFLLLQRIVSIKKGNVAPRSAVRILR